MKMYRENATEDRSLLIVALSGNVMALDARSGKRRWEYALGGVATEVLVHGGRVYVVGSQRPFVVLEYATGREMVKHANLATWNGRPTMLIDQGRVFVASGGEVFCFDLEGELLWQNEMKGRGIGSIALALPDHARQADLSR